MLLEECDCCRIQSNLSGIVVSVGKEIKIILLDSETNVIFVLCEKSNTELNN
jgi:hypothetical protein